MKNKWKLIKYLGREEVAQGEEQEQKLVWQHFVMPWESDFVDGEPSHQPAFNFC